MIGVGPKANASLPPLRFLEETKEIARRESRRTHDLTSKAQITGRLALSD